MSSNTREDRPSGKLEDCVRAFEVCASRGIDLILVGGQACHFYAWRYVEESPFLRSLFPLTSKDADFFGGEFEARELATALKGRFRPSPRKGGFLGLVVGRIATDGGPEIDVVGRVHGLGDREVRKTALREEYHGSGLKVLHPVLLYESKAASLFELDQNGRQDARHLDIMQDVLPRWLQEIARQPSRQPELLMSLERLFDFSLGRIAPLLAKKGRPLPPALIPDFGASANPKLNNWREKRLPQWHRELARRGL
jgi:hypothetical protein